MLLLEYTNLLPLDREMLSFIIMSFSGLDYWDLSWEMSPKQSDINRFTIYPYVLQKWNYLSCKANLLRSKIGTKYFFHSYILKRYDKIAVPIIFSIIAISIHSHIKRKQLQKCFLQYSYSVTMINVVKKYLRRKIHELNTLIGYSDDS